MRKVFVDANTLISGIVFKGLEHEVLKLSLSGRVELVTSEDVVGEVTRVLERKFPSRKHLLIEFLKLAGVKVLSRHVYASLISLQSVRDEDDRHVLAAAIASKCEFIVTGDRDLLELTHKTLKIVTSRSLLALSP